MKQQGHCQNCLVYNYPKNYKSVIKFMSKIFRVQDSFVDVVVDASDAVVDASDVVVVVSSKFKSQSHPEPSKLTRQRQNKKMCQQLSKPMSNALPQKSRTKPFPLFTHPQIDHVNVNKNLQT